MSVFDLTVTQIAAQEAVALKKKNLRDARVVELGASLQKKLVDVGLKGGIVVDRPRLAAITDLDPFYEITVTPSGTSVAIYFKQQYCIDKHAATIGSDIWLLIAEALLRDSSPPI